jgi:hypothetical protein
MHNISFGDWFGSGAEPGNLSQHRNADMSRKPQIQGRRKQGTPSLSKAARAYKKFPMSPPDTDRRANAVGNGDEEEDGEMDEMGDENEEEDLGDNEVDDVRCSHRTELNEDWDGPSEGPTMSKRSKNARGAVILR